MAARKLFIVLALMVLGAGSGCRSYCERNYPCPQPGYAPYCPPAPAYGAVPAAPAGAYGPGVARTGCTCTCP